jgi:hypothetical protein
MQTQTQVQKIDRYLSAGRSLTSAEARSRFGIKNLRARICEMRQDGYDIEAVPYVRKNGASANKYRFNVKVRKAKRS